MAVRIPFFRRARRLLAPAYGSHIATEHVARGDEARAKKDWTAAAAAYRAAVEDRPELAAIWIQLGHAYKEHDALTAAIDAYGKAAKLRPGDPDPHIFIAHIYKRLGRTDLSIVHFLDALHAGETSAHESDELIRLIAQRRDRDRSTLITLLYKTLDRLPPNAKEAPLLTQLRDTMAEVLAARVPQQDERPTTVFDISDLISYYSNARLPTGIQRVQIEAIEGAVSGGGDRDIRLCCFIDGREEWLELPLRRMRAIAQLSKASGDRFDPQWTEAMAGLRLFLSLTDPFEFPRGASLINLGTSWWLQNYFLFVRHAKKTRGIRYIPFVHDMIPIMTPEHCTRGLTQDFISWVIGVFDHADHFLVNSKATKKDLLAVARTLGHDLADDDVAVIPLDTDFRKNIKTELPVSALDQWQLKPNGFVLFVSTIESRKGHLIAFEAWAELIRRHGADAVPQLVCVGNRGWLNDHIYARMAEDDVLARKVSMLSRLSDEELALLYRSSLFTLYPSTYEGWGLPVTESLCYGKVPLISDAASLPEAGGDFAIYAKAGSVDALTDAAERLILDADHRAAVEARIVAEFRPRSWSELAGQITDELNRFALRDAHKGVLIPPPLTAQPGAWHPMMRNESVRIWSGMRTGEGFRSNLGWHWPESRGCRIRFEGGELTLRLEGPHPMLRILLQLSGDENGLALWSLRCGDESAKGELNAHDSKWIAFEIPASGITHDHRVRLEALPAADGVVITYFLRGFYLHAADDVMSRQDLLEAITLNRLDSITAFREN